MNAQFADSGRMRSLVAAVLFCAPWTLHAQCVPGAFLAVSRKPPNQGEHPSPGSPPFASGPLNIKSSSVGKGHQSLEGSQMVKIGESQILALPVRTIVTATDWTPVSRFEGPLLRDVLLLSGKSAPPDETLTIFALNQYAVSLPLTDLEKYEPILALSRNGARLQRTDFGPMFIVYPRDAFEELRQPTMASRMAWQVCRIDIR